MITILINDSARKINPMRQRYEFYNLTVQVIIDEPETLGTMQNEEVSLKRDVCSLV